MATPAKLERDLPFKMKRKIYGNDYKDIVKDIKSVFKKMNEEMFYDSILVMTLHMIMVGIDTHKYLTNEEREKLNKLIIEEVEKNNRIVAEKRRKVADQKSI